MILSCAYSLSNDKFINPALILLFDILPGFLIQLAYPYILYNIPYKYNILILYFTLIFCNISMFVNNIYINLLGISLISINSYFGELVFLSLTTKYNKDTIKFWSIGTGLAGIFGI